MRTLHDLEAAFGELAATAPDVDALTVPTTAPRRPLRRTVAPAVAALATAAVIGAVLVATVPGDDPSPAAATVTALRPPAADGSADTTFRFTADAPAGATTVRSFAVDRGGQRLEFQLPPDGPRCVTAGDVAVVNANCRRVAAVTLLYAGRPTASDVVAFDPDRLLGRVRQDVDGRRGYFGTLGGDTARLPELENGPAVHLYWQYAPGAWGDAVAVTRAEALALARSVRPDALHLDVPVELRPTAGQYLNTVTAERSAVGGGYEITSSRTVGAFVSWGEGDTQSGGTVTDAQPIPINGRTWQFRTDNGSPQAVLVGGPVPISIQGYVGTSRAALEAMVERVRIAADPADTTTWLPASHLR